MKKLSTLIAGLLAMTTLAFGQSTSPVSGRYPAVNYSQWQMEFHDDVAAGSNAVQVVPVGTRSIAAQNNSCLVGYYNGTRQSIPFSVGERINVVDGSSSETALALTGVSVSNGICTLTATWANAHKAGTLIRTGTGGLDEAINDVQANSASGGIVSVGPEWTVAGGTTALLAGALPYVGVTLEDTRAASVRYWNMQQAAATFLATPATLTGTTALPSATPVGAYGTGTYHLAIAYVDCAGQVGPESADFSEAGLATGSFIFSAPAASAGACGYVIYISLTGGTYSLDYEVPLTNSICTLTKLETVTPACAVANASYGQTGAVATVTAITVSTSPVGMLLGGVSGTFLTGNPNGRTTYAYVASNHIAAFGIPTVNLAFTAGGIGSATPIAMGTVNLPAGFLNQVGASIRVCGKELNTDVNSSIQNINIFWDAAGSDVAGSPVQLAGLKATGTGTAAAYAGNFCKTFTTTVSGAGATAGSILPGADFFTYYLVSSGNVVGTGSDTIAAAVASLNLAGTAGFENRLSIVHTNTTGNATPTLQSLTIEVL